MTSETVTSPVGDRIEIVSNEDWVKVTDTPEHGLRQWYVGRKPWVIRALWEHGEFTNSSGRATLDLYTYMAEHYEMPGQSDNSKSVTSLLAHPMNAPAFERATNGKRTHAIKLVALPEIWYRKLMQDIADSPNRNGDQAAAEAVAALVLPEAPETAPQAPVVDKTQQEAPQAPWTDDDWSQLQLDAPTIYEEPPPLEIHIANQVALSLLTTVVEIISSGSADTTQLTGATRLTQELEQSQHLLSQRLMENDKLRRQLREAGDAITALRTERDGLRTRLRMTEHNLTEVLKGETAQAVNSEIQKRVDQFMRTAPTAKGD